MQNEARETSARAPRSVLSADLGVFSLADVLGWIHEAGRSGYLAFASGGAEKGVYFSRGEVVFAESNRPEDRLGASLLRAGALTADQLAEVESRFHERTRFGRIVVELGFLSPRELWGGVKQQVEDIVRSLFVDQAGHVQFFDGEIEPDNVVRLSLRTRRLIDEGLAEQASRAAAATREEAELQELVERHAKLIFELAAPLIALDGPRAVADRLNRILEESVVGEAPLLGVLRLGDTATLDPARVIEEARSLPGDRITALEEPLSEMAAYLEFELKNHPGIEDADAFLEAVGPLRAMLRR